MSDLREISVLVENLTDEEFQLEETHVDSSETRALLQPCFKRFTKLRWQCGGNKCQVVVEYCTVQRDAVTEAEPEGQSVVRPRQRFIVAVTLPRIGTRTVGRWAANWVPGMSGAGTCFTASLTALGKWSSDLQHNLDDVVLLDDGVGDGCEWMVLVNEPNAVEVRLRLLPQGPVPDVIPRDLEPDDGEADKELRQDESEMRRLRGYLSVISTLNAQAARLDDLCSSEPMNLARIKSLPEKVRIDLLLAVLCVLCRHKEFAWQRYADEDYLQGDEPCAPLLVDDDSQSFTSKASYSSATTLEKVAGGISSGKETLKSVFKGSKKATEQKEIFDTSLRDHAECVYRALVPLVGFGDVHTNQKIADLVKCYLPAKDSADASIVQVPNPAMLCTVVREALDSGCGCADWSVDQVCEVGLDDAVARFLTSARLIDSELAHSVPIAVEGLNSGRIFCPEDFCFAYSGEEQAYRLLYREGKKEQTLAQLGIESESELLLEHSVAPVPSNEAPLKLLARQLLVENVTGDSGLSLDGPKHGRSELIAASAVPQSWLVARDFFAMTIGAGAGCFDARSRAALYDFASGLGVPPRLAARWENEIGGALFEMLEASTALERQRAERKKWRRAKVGAAAVGGGVLLAVTGGMAAPVLAAGASAAGGAASAAGAAVGLTHTGLAVGGALAAFGTALTGLGTAGAVVLFGATGAGLTGWKLKRRWGNLEEFEFQPLTTTKVRRHVFIDIPSSDAKTVKRIDAAIEAGDGILQEDMLVDCADGQEAPLHAGSELDRRECIMRQGVNGVDASESSVVRFRLVRHVDVQERAVHVAIFVTGWLQSEEDFTKPWAEAARICFPSSGHLAIRWESKGLQRLNKMFKDMVTNELASNSANFWLKGIAAGAATAGSYAAMAAAWPITIISSMSNLDNAWLVSVQRARLAGECLAHVLADRHTVGQRPVSLVGHSMGARLLFYCMLELHRMGEFHVVDDVVLLGTPASTRLVNWRKVRAAASGRVVNGFLRGDWALAFFYRYLEFGLTVAGLSEVHVPGVENVDLKGLGIKGHSDYPNHIADILSKMRIGERRVFVV